MLQENIGIISVVEREGQVQLLFLRPRKDEVGKAQKVRLLRRDSWARAQGRELTLHDNLQANSWRSFFFPVY